MKYFILILLIIVFTTPVYSVNLITVTEVRGKVELKETGGNWKLLTEGTEVPQGSIISTGFKSSAELDLGGSSTVYIKQLTRMSVDQLAISGKKVNTKLNLKLGRIKADVKTSAGLKHNFTLKTPVSTAAVRGTVFEGAATGYLEVETGQIKQSNKIGQSTTVSEGNSTSVSGSGYSAPVPEAAAVTESYTVETSTQPEETIPEIFIPPPEPTTGTIFFTWDVQEPPS